MRWYLLAIFAYLLTVMQTTLFVPRLLGSAFQREVRPDLLLLLAVFVALRVDPGLAFMVAWCLGLVEGLSLHAGEGPLGATALLFAVVAWMVCMVRPILDPMRILTQILLALVTVFALRLPQQVLQLWLTDHPLVLAEVLQRSLGDAIYSAILAPYLFWLLNRILVRPEPLRK